jgi:hypothetical protein
MVVVASGARPVDEVATDLKKAGFEVDQVLQGIGQVIGHASPSLKERLKRIHGVADVSETHDDFNIGPPDAPVQ